MLPSWAHAQALIADSGFAAPALAECNTDLVYLNQVGGWQAVWPSEWQMIAKKSIEISSAEVAKWQNIDKTIETLIEKLREGIENEAMAPRAVVLRVQQQVIDLSLELKDTNSNYFARGTRGKHSGEWNHVIRSKVEPSISQFKDFLTEIYLPIAPKSPGLIQIENGASCFKAASLWWTTLDINPNEVERIGKRLLSENKTELLRTAQEGEDIDELLQRLREVPTSTEVTVEELLRISEAAIERASQRAKQMFATPPTDSLSVVELSKQRQAASPAGFYGQASNGQGAQYTINTSRPRERRLMAEVIAFHEGIPGHHLWATYPRKQPSTGYNSGILEGWAIYAEILADEMGLFSSQLDRQGMITKHLWAASRLIVEPGLHLHGWSREKAIQFMLNNTVLSRTEIEIEVDRYIAMPGQSLSYMLGADLILSERENAEYALGEAFDVKAFHDIVLVPGVRSLSEVRGDIRSWVASSVKNNKS